MNLSIVIVNWNSGSLLKECLDSIAESAANLPPGCNLESVVVVDNYSTDDSLSITATDHAHIVLIRNNENRGFSVACNQGAAACKSSELILFLNPDTRLFNDSLNSAVHGLTRNGAEHVGIVGIALQDASGHVAPSCSRFPRAHHFLFHALGIDRFWPQAGTAMIEWDHLDTRTVDQVIGAFFLIRRSVFDSLGGFDERFFVYFEEVDLSLRARKAGWASLHVAEGRAYHLGGGTTQAVRARRLYYSWHSRLRYFDKHSGLVERALLRSVTWGIEPFSRLLLLAMRGRFSEISELIHAYRLLLRSTV